MYHEYLSSMHMGESPVLKDRVLQLGQKAAGNGEWHLKQQISIRLKHIARQLPARESKVGNIPIREIRIKGQRH